MPYAVTVHYFDGPLAGRRNEAEFPNEPERGALIILPHGFLYALDHLIGDDVWLAKFESSKPEETM